MDALGIRSLLFVPGDTESRIGKALESSADAVIVELEGSVTPENKRRAREVATRVLSVTERNGKAVFVRVNSFQSGLTAGELAAVISAKPWGVALPKCEGRADLQRLSHYL